MITLIESSVPKIKDVEPCYTGGGFYVYYGALMDGNYFMAGTPDFFITIVDSDPRLTANADNGDLLDADYADWQEEHLVRYIDSDTDESVKFFDEMFKYIIDKEPTGGFCNYSLSEMEELQRVNLSPDRDEY